MDEQQIKITLKRVTNGYIMVEPNGLERVYVTLEQLMTAVKDWMK